MPQSVLLRRLLSLVWRYRWGCLKVLMLQLALLSMGLLGLSLTGLGVDYIRFAVGQRGVEAALATVKPPLWPFGLAPVAGWSPMTTLTVIAGAILLFAALRSLLNAFYTLASARLIQANVIVDLRKQVFAKLQRLSFRFYDSNASGTIINRVTGDVQAVRAFVDQVVMQSLILIISLVCYLVYMLRIHVGLTLACLATTPLLWWLTRRFSRRVRPAYLIGRDLFDRLVLLITENLKGVHVIKGFARQGEAIAGFRKVNREVEEQKRWVFGVVSTFQPLIGFMTQINLLVLLAYGGLLVIRYEQAVDLVTAAGVGLSIGQLIVFSGLLQQFSGQVANIANIANTMQHSFTGAQRVFEILDAPVEVVSKPDARRPDSIRGEVRFENVGFAYQPGNPVLRDISFTVRPGQCVAIVGATGCGKTTLLSLIPRFYDPAAGRILIDGIDLRDLHLESLRRHIGLVFQESFLFSTTVAENIAFGHPDATREQIERAARIASAHDFIMELPKGYDTVLAESGASLSGGQRQRLAIARALLLEPPILLLDDPTAAIDPQTEDDILVAMDNAIRGRTTFLVAHRLSTLRRADFVIVLDDGCVAQRGTHAALMDDEGLYRWAASFQTADAESLRLLGFETGGSVL